jgi:hypothetical protein
MLPFTAMTATRPTASPAMAAIYAAIATAIVAIATALLFQTEILILYILAFLLIGAAPVVGYQLATGRLGSDWRPLVGGFLSFILLILGWLLWPILVGAMTRGQSVGKLFIASLVGFILGVIVFLIAGTVAGQDPAWVTTGFTLLCAVWGAVVGWAMAAWSEPAVA